MIEWARLKSSAEAEHFLAGLIAQSVYPQKAARLAALLFRIARMGIGWMSG